MKNKRWTRREFIGTSVVTSLSKPAGLGASITALTPAVSLAQQQSVPLPGLDQAETDTLRLAIDEIVPAADGMPAASQVGVLEYIGGLVRQDTSLVDALIQALQALETVSKETLRDSFSSLAGADRVEALKSLEINEPDLFARLRTAVYEGYYTRPEIWRLIGYEPHPTNTLGPMMTPFDANSLSRVRELPPLYKEVE